MRQVTIFLTTLFVMTCLLSEVNGQATNEKKSQKELSKDKPVESMEKLPTTPKPTKVDGCPGVVVEDTNIKCPKCCEFEESSGITVHSCEEDCTDPEKGGCPPCILIEPVTFGDQEVYELEVVETGVILHAEVYEVFEEENYTILEFEPYDP